MDGYRPPVATPPEPLPAWGQVSQWGRQHSTTASWPAWSVTATSATTSVTGATLYTWADQGGTATVYVSARAQSLVASGWAQTTSTGIVEAVPASVRDQMDVMRAARVVRRVAQIERFYDTRRDRLDVSSSRTPPEISPIESARAMGLLRDEADKRARALLLSVLNAEQRAMFERPPIINVGGVPSFRVVSNLGNVFELYRKRMHGVFKLDAEGNRVEEWCVTPNGRIPLDDVLVMQKLALETDELALRAQANVWNVATGRQMYHAPDQWLRDEPQPDYVRLAAG